MTAATSIIVACQRLEIRLWEEVGKLRFGAAAGVVTDTVKDCFRSHKSEIIHALANPRESAPDPSAGPAIQMSWLGPTHPALSALDPNRWRWQAQPAAVYAAHRYECLDAEMLAAAVVELGAKALLVNRGEIDRLAAQMVLEMFSAGDTGRHISFYSIKTTKHHLLGF